MKLKLNQALPVKFGVDLSTVSKIEFIFTQEGKVKYKCEYPSTQAVRKSSTENIVNVIFDKDATLAFRSGEDYPVSMDTRITLTSSTLNPQTDIVTFYFDPTLF